MISTIMKKHIPLVLFVSFFCGCGEKTTSKNNSDAVQNISSDISMETKLEIKSQKVQTISENQSTITTTNNNRKLCTPEECYEKLESIVYSQSLQNIYAEDGETILAVRGVTSNEKDIVNISVFFHSNGDVAVLEFENKNGVNTPENKKNTFKEFASKFIDDDNLIEQALNDFINFYNKSVAGNINKEREVKHYQSVDFTFTALYNDFDKKTRPTSVSIAINKH